MEKRISLRAEAEDNGMELGHFLRCRMGLGKKEISRAKFLEDGICVNGERRKITAVLRTGDLVKVLLEDGKKTSPQLISSKNKIEILYEDEDVIVLDKPAGLSVHPPGRAAFSGDTLAGRLAFYLRQKQEDCVIRIFGRLDKDTSGVVLAAKSRTAAARLERQREDGILKKTYLAAVRGVPGQPEGEICAPLGPDPRNRTRMQIRADGKYALTRYWVLDTRRTAQNITDGNGKKNSGGTSEELSCSLVRLQLETGRTHQIRVHMASIGCPLLGDSLYGNQDGEQEKEQDAALMNRAALHAAELVFRQPFSGKELRIQARLPKDIARIFDSVIE